LDDPSSDFGRPFEDSRSESELRLRRRNNSQAFIPLNSRPQPDRFADYRRDSGVKQQFVNLCESVDTVKRCKVGTSHKTVP
jgi:hypothetical protein